MGKGDCPSAELRRWFGHEAEKFPEFTEKYKAELDTNPTAALFASYCQKALSDHDITLLFGAKDTKHNQAVVLLHWINDKAL